MKRLAGMLAALALFPTLSWAQPEDAERTVALALNDEPVSRSAEVYASLSRCAVKIEPGLYPTITLVTGGVARAEALQLLEAAWRSNGVAVVKRAFPCKVYLFPDASRVPDALLDDPPPAPPLNGLERRLIRKPWEQTEPAGDS